MACGQIAAGTCPKGSRPTATVGGCRGDAIPVRIPRKFGRIRRPFDRPRLASDANTRFRTALREQSEALGPPGFPHVGLWLCISYQALARAEVRLRRVAGRPDDGLWRQTGGLEVRLLDRESTSPARQRSPL